MSERIHNNPLSSGVMSDNVEVVNERPKQVIIIIKQIRIIQARQQSPPIVQIPVEQRAGAASPAQSRCFWLRSKDSEFCCCNVTATGAGPNYDDRKK